MRERERERESEWILLWIENRQERRHLLNFNSYKVRICVSHQDG